MANENFGLGFTVSDFALWLEEEGYVGPAATIFGDLVASDITGPAATIFGDLVSIDTTGPAATIFADLVAASTTGPAATAYTIGLCPPVQILSLPGKSVLSGPGISTMSCP